uniref:von Willebrand factor A domain-containing protein 8 n=1 Tax=Photinus pyralis TaxID=7054 RepID=A0A1Y1MII6_PHOPY
MQNIAATNRRAQVLLRILQHNRSKIRNVRLTAIRTNSTVTIGGVTKVVQVPNNPEYVPKNYFKEMDNQSTLHNLRWMLQKDLLAQDIFLIGAPGPKRRHLAMQYLELTNREVEYVALSRDTTESDLKQRREIVKGSSTYFDQSAVRAAIKGRVLVIEGIEKAERNVLPVLNNLLENREMQLEDGRMLIDAKRYDQLLQSYSKDELDKRKLVRVDEHFRVIALGLPVPKYIGNPMDPPLRSRFQARDISSSSYQELFELLQLLGPNLSKESLDQILSVAIGLTSKESTALGLPDFPIDNLHLIVRIMNNHPDLSVYNAVYRLYPYNTISKEAASAVETLLSKFSIDRCKGSSYVSNIAGNISNLWKKPKPETTHPDGYIETDYQNKLVEEMLQTIKLTDLCVIGPRGCGKNVLVSKVAEIVGTKIESIMLYQDITSRDLIQQRATLDNGDTIWRFSPLVNAMIDGKIVVLDGIHRVHPSTISVLHRLVHDRELQLHDGRRMVSAEKYDILQKAHSEAYLQQNGMLKIHPNFRIIALGELSNMQPTRNWLTSEILSLFLFHETRFLTKMEEMHIITSKFGPISETLQKIIDFAHILRVSPDPILKQLSGHMSTRQLLRISKRLQKFPNEDMYEILQTVFMTQFLPTLTRQTLENAFAKMEIVPQAGFERKPTTYSINNNVLTIGNTSAFISATEEITKVPQVLFYDVPQHIQLMEKLLQDFQLGLHLLLVGNQGVGKNKIVDRFLGLLNRPREYIQLHRDTTVQTLTVQPTIKDGILVYEDSPLVKAVKYGHVLVIDEADKAPTHVTCILKTLIEFGQMLLSDGRRITTAPLDENDIQIHPDFRMIVLANRPGFPFLGNDFFSALGDLFSCHAVDNPSRSSEIDLLVQYGPDVPIDTIKKLVDIFGDLRSMADEGLVTYPYSTREVVNIVKHLQKFPQADIDDALFNVFDFDKYNQDAVETLGQVLIKHGFPKTNMFTAEYLALKQAKEYLQVTVDRTSGLDTKGPKHGKEDPKNEPHVGGNTWAGGTGGRDTAGLGGKGGPYRLDKGHKVHQLSDEEKAAVPEHIKRAAREMGRKAFEERLKEIGMSGYDASLYAQFSGAVSKQVLSLRIILGSLQAKNKERQWTKNKTSGELDDTKLIDGLLGEKTIFRRRTELEPELGSPQIKPKMLRLVVDVSASMYRFNSYDGRLDRQLEAVVLLMEAMEGFDDKIQYDIMGHSGDAHDIKFITKGNPPKNNKERLNILKTMYAHSQFCFAGDNTLEATELAIKSMSDGDFDEAIVVVLSDANLQRYSIPSSELAKVLSQSEKINSYAVFIGSLGDQAERLTQSLPAGRSFICKDVSTLPQILKQIFSSSVINF